MSAKKTPKPLKKEPKSYGRQSDGKTITSLSLRKEVVAAAKKRAKELGISLSQFVDEVIEKNSSALSSVSIKPTPRRTSKKSTKKQPKKGD